MTFIQAGIVRFKFATADHENYGRGTELNRLEIVRKQRLPFTVLALGGLIVSRVGHLPGFKHFRCNIEDDHAP